MDCSKAITDYEHAIQLFIDALEELADHIQGHQIIVAANRTAEQARVGAQMLQLALSFEGPPIPDDNAPTEARSAWAQRYAEEEDEAWSEAWAYVGKHIRKWWD